MPRIPRTLARAHAAALPHVRPRRRALAAFAALSAPVTLALAGCADGPLPTPPAVAHSGRPAAFIVNLPDPIPWISKPAMREARKGLVAASVNGIVYAIGGAKDSVVGVADTYEEKIEVPQRTVEAFYPNSLFYAPWRLKAPLPGRRAYANGATVINGKIYVSGGKYRKDGVDSIAKSLFVYTPSTNIWEPKADMPAPSFGGVRAVADGKLYVVGGLNGSTLLTRMDAYNPRDEQLDAEGVPPEAAPLSRGDRGKRGALPAGREDGQQRRPRRHQPGVRRTQTSEAARPGAFRAASPAG